MERIRRYAAYVHREEAADYEKMGWLIGQPSYDDGAGNITFIAHWPCQCNLPLLKGGRHERAAKAEAAE